MSAGVTLLSYKEQHEIADRVTQMRHDELVGVLKCVPVLPSPLRRPPWQLRGD